MQLFFAESFDLLFAFIGSDGFDCVVFHVVAFKSNYAYRKMKYTPQATVNNYI